MDELETLSKPVEVIKSDLSEIFVLNFRDSKKGREFIPVFDDRHLLKFQVKYSYVSKFLEKDNAAGNHYHMIKQEILIPLQGTFTIDLQDVKSKRRESHYFDASKERKAIYIRTEVSHKITSHQDTGIVLVLASSPSKIEDEVDYSIN